MGTYRRLYILMTTIFSITFLFMLIYGNLCAFTWGRYMYKDYGKYLNLLWNTVHGRFLRHSVNESFLSSHLGFTIALFSPFFLIWDHPFLLSILQWTILVFGVFVIWRCMVFLGLDPLFRSSIIFFYISNPFTQSVLLCEPHTVGLYLLFFPILYYFLLKYRNYIWLPFILFLGIREEAGLLVIPMFLYFAIKEKWKAGFLYSSIALVYVIIAVKFGLPQLGGVLLETRRGLSLNPMFYLKGISLKGFLMKMRPIKWIFLAFLPIYFSNGAIPILIIPLTALVWNIFSPYRDVYQFKYHYPAGFIVVLVIGAIEAVRQMGRLRGPYKWVISIFLFIFTIFWHYNNGFLKYSKGYNRFYGTIHPRGLKIIEIVKHIPKEGILLCDNVLGGFCANRRDIITPDYLGRDNYRPDIIFTKRGGIERQLENFKGKPVSIDTIFEDEEYEIVKVRWR